MSNEMFRLESFRPWKPVQDSSLRQEERLSPRRYPSPVSLGGTPSPSNTKNLGLDSQVTCTSKPERHPLPVRPPIEVCVDGGSHSVDQATRQPESADQTSPADQNSGNLDFDGIFGYQSALGSGQIDGIILGSIDKGPEQRADVETCDEASFCRPAPDLQSMMFSPAVFPDLGDSTGDQTVDPSLLADHELRDCEPEHTSKITSARPASAEVYRKIESPSSQGDANCRGQQQSSLKARNPSRRSSRVQKVSVVIDNRPNGRRPDLQRGSLSTMSAQFSALPAEERLQFLSWLFETALTRCVPCFGDASGALPSQDASSSRTERASSGPCSPRKQHRYSEEEDRLLIQLKGEGLAWREVIRCFDEYFPGRSAASIKVHWSTKLSKQGPSRP